MPDLIGGRWELVEPFATGSTSTVWRAIDHELNVECAAKVLRQRDAGNLLRFAREQSRRLVHPHIVAPYAWCADDGTVLIASELVAGGSLRTLIGDFGPLSEGTVVVIVDQLLAALGAVHAAGIVHRDVNPGNVLLRLSEGGEIDLALVDFGIALAQHDARLTVAGTVIGTPGYVAPDLLSGAASPAPAHDLYSAGKLAVALLLGQEDGDPEEAVRACADPALAEALRRMCAIAGASSATDASEIRELLAAAYRDPRPRDRDGDVITLLEQVGAGDAETREREILAPPDPGEATTEPRTAVLPAEPARATTQIPHQDPAEAVSPVVRRWRWAVVAVAGGLFLVFGAAFALNALTEDRVGPSPSVSTPGVPPASTDPTDGVDPVGDEDCSWQSEGDSGTAEDGTTVVCTLVDGTYRWVTP